MPGLAQKRYGITRKEFDEYRYVSAAVQNKKGIKRLASEIQAIREARKTDTIAQVAEQFGLSPTTIQRYSSKKNLETEGN